uniref:Uncharacterized protein n=2 Tax=Enterobacter asburiae TaxID=61645 RepID=A0A455W331_ENTAS|nr:hypothetical protein MRY18106EAS_P0880 [Enterobacter asburiae]
MIYKMKKLVCASALIWSSASVLAADFSDRQVIEADLTYARQLNKVKLKLSQIKNLSAGQNIQAGTKIANLSVISEYPAQLGFRWSDKIYQSIQENGRIVQVNHVSEPNTYVTLAFAEKQGVSPITEGTDTFFVSDVAGNLTNDIVLAANQDIMPGSYLIAVDAAVYNP